MRPPVLPESARDVLDQPAQGEVALMRFSSPPDGQGQDPRPAAVAVRDCVRPHRRSPDVDTARCPGRGAFCSWLARNEACHGKVGS
jgi:hypothetical protein